MPTGDPELQLVPGPEFSHFAAGKTPDQQEKEDVDLIMSSSL